jgi:dTDP-D-glucose 4,6-dehydratase
MTEPILVTGGAGYIGSYACKALARAGYLRVTYDSLVTGNCWAVKWEPLEHGDITDRERLLDVMARHRPLAVVHFAAAAYVGESMVDPAKYYRNNVGVHSRFLNACGLRISGHCLLKDLSNLRHSTVAAHNRVFATSTDQSVWPHEAHGRADAPGLRQRLWFVVSGP